MGKARGMMMKRNTFSRRFFARKNEGKSSVTATVQTKDAVLCQ